MTDRSLHFRSHTAGLCGELGLPAQAMQHPVVVKASGCVINVPANALGFCEVKGCAFDRRDSPRRNAVLCRGNVVIPASPRQAAWSDPCLLLQFQGSASFRQAYWQRAHASGPPTVARTLPCLAHYHMQVAHQLLPGQYPALLSSTCCKAVSCKS